jgi:uncharacterized protein (TIGR03086 family)
VAVSYAMTSAAAATTDVLLSSPTPCAGWDLARLLAHVSDSIEVISEAITADQIGPVPARRRSESGTGPVVGLRRHAARLLATCAAGPGEHTIAIADRKLTARTLAVAGAIEIAVHGWDIAAACGARQPIPSRLAAVLLPLAPLIITARIRPGLFADPVRLAGPACPGDELVAFLGRQPCPAQGLGRG